MPKSWLQLQPPSEVSRTWGSGRVARADGQRLDLGGCTIYLDESGGVHSSDVRTRRCGWGLGEVVNPQFENMSWYDLGFFKFG